MSVFVASALLLLVAKAESCGWGIAPGVLLLLIGKTESCGWGFAPGVDQLPTTTDIPVTDEFGIRPVTGRTERPFRYPYMVHLAEVYNGNVDLLTFATYDSNGDKNVTKGELKKALGKEVDDAVVCQVFTDVDTNGDEVVSCKEFLDAPFWPSQHRNEISCGGKVEAPLKEFSCPRLFGRYSDPGDCSKWFMCSWGHPYHMNCPSGLHFDNQLKVCNYPRAALCMPRIDCFAGVTLPRPP